MTAPRTTALTASTAPAAKRPVADVVAGYWKELLGCDAVDPAADFLALGGNSLLATMLANRIEDDLGVRPQIIDLFAAFAQVVRVCEALIAEAAAAERAPADAPEAPDEAPDDRP